MAYRAALEPSMTRITMCLLRVFGTVTRIAAMVVSITPISIRLSTKASCMMERDRGEVPSLIAMEISCLMESG